MPSGVEWGHPVGGNMFHAQGNNAGQGPQGFASIQLFAQGGFSRSDGNLYGGGNGVHVGSFVSHGQVNGPGSPGMYPQGVVSRFFFVCLSFACCVPLSCIGNLFIGNEHEHEVFACPSFPSTILLCTRTHQSLYLFLQKLHVTVIACTVGRKRHKLMHFTHDRISRESAGPRAASRGLLFHDHMGYE